jgi:hypothetical protein
MSEAKIQIEQFKSELQIEIEQLKTHMEKARAKDQNDMREWINGSFMRSKEAISTIRALDARVARVENGRA